MCILEKTPELANTKRGCLQCPDCKATIPYNHGSLQTSSAEQVCISPQINPELNVPQGDE